MRNPTNLDVVSVPSLHNAAMKNIVEKCWELQMKNIRYMCYPLNTHVPSMTKWLPSTSVKQEKIIQIN